MLISPYNIMQPVVWNFQELMNYFYIRGTTMKITKSEMQELEKPIVQGKFRSIIKWVQTAKNWEYWTWNSSMKSVLIWDEQLLQAGLRIGQMKTSQKKTCQNYPKYWIVLLKSVTFLFGNQQFKTYHRSLVSLYYDWT